MLRQKGGHQRDPQEELNQDKASYQEAQESLSLPVQGTRRESKNSRTNDRGRVH